MAGSDSEAEGLLEKAGARKAEGEREDPADRDVKDRRGTFPGEATATGTPSVVIVRVTELSAALVLVAVAEVVAEVEEEGCDPRADAELVVVKANARKERERVIVPEGTPDSSHVFFSVPTAATSRTDE